MTPERVRLPRADLQYSLQLAEFVAILGHNDRAFDRLETAMHGGVVNYPFLFARDLVLPNLRSDRSFEPLMAQVKAVWVRM